ncbi:MAG: YgjV family protein [Defluviitaleaceae bacterium]|nr:YgjV family protein [Defluviitaleaceae bacterium]
MNIPYPGSFAFVQILGIITLILFVISVQQRKKENFLLFQIAGTLLFILQYVLTGSYTAAILFTIVLIRGLVFFYYKKKGLKPSRAVLIIFLTALGISTIISWQNILSIMPLIATAAKTWGTWQDNMGHTRKTSLLAQSSMIIYNLSAHIYTGALTEACNLVSTIIAIKRYDFYKEKP